MTSKPSFMTSEGHLILNPRIFMTSLLSLMLSRLTKKESTASGNGAIVSPIFG
jgi:hypothetical protein